MATRLDSLIQGDNTIITNVQTATITKTLMMVPDGSFIRFMGGEKVTEPAPQSLINARDAYLAEWDSYIDTLVAANKI